MQTGGVQRVGQLGDEGGVSAGLGGGRALVVEVDAGIALGLSLADDAADLGVLDGGVVEQSAQGGPIDDGPVIGQTQEAGGLAFGG